MKFIKTYIAIFFVFLSVSCSLLSSDNHPFSGNWRGNGQDSKGSKFNFEATVIKINENKFRILIMDKIGSNNKPFHIIVGELNDNIFVSSSDGGKYKGGGELHQDVYKGFYQGPVNGSYTMWRIKEP